MAKDRSKNRNSPGYTAAYNKERYDLVHVRFTKESGMKQAIQNMALKKHVSLNEYITESVANQLAHDGLSEKDTEF